MKPLEILNMEKAVAKEIDVPYHDVFLAGSTRITGKRGKDVDFVVCGVDSDALLSAGFEREIEPEYETHFDSWRRGEVNVIAIRDRMMFYAEVAICLGAAAQFKGGFDISERDGRIEFHQKIRSECLFRLEEHQEAEVEDLFK